MRRLGAGLAAATCCLLMLAALDANLSDLLRPKPHGEVSSFRLVTPSLPPPPPPLAQPRSRTGEALRAPQPRLAHPTAADPAGERGGPAASPLPVPPAIVLPRAVAAVSGPPAPAPDAAPPKPRDETERTALAAYQRQLWARISARKPAGIHLAGVATVRFAVGDDGALTAVELAASSGNAALDRLALRTVRHAAPFPAPPIGAERDQLVFTIPFSFH